MADSFRPYIDGSGAITTGATSQKLFDAYSRRRYFLFQNISDTDMYLNFGVAAVSDQPSIKVAAGATFEPRSVDPRQINVICATTGKKFVAKQC